MAGIPRLLVDTRKVVYGSLFYRCCIGGASFFFSPYLSLQTCIFLFYTPVTYGFPKKGT